jgi:hypothetical protein
MLRDMASKGWALPLALAVTACGGGGGGAVDAGGGGDTDAGMAIMLPVLSTGTMANPTMGTPDHACAGTRTQPAPGAELDVNFQLRYFGEGSAARNTRVWFFADNVIRDTCEPANCQEFTSAMDTGNAMVRAAASSWYAYRVFARMGPTAGTTVVDSVQYNEEAPAASGGSVEGNAVAQQTLNLIPAVLGFTREPGRALVAGEVQDCAGNPMYGATIRMYDGDAEIPEGELNADPHYRFFNGDSSPDAAQMWTNSDGLYAAANIPPPAAGGLVRIEAWGRRTEADTVPVRLGCEAARMLVDGVTIVNIGPERSDYPAGHPCAR